MLKVFIFFFCAVEFIKNSAAFLIALLLASFSLFLRTELLNFADAIILIYRALSIEKANNLTFLWIVTLIRDATFYRGVTRPHHATARGANQLPDGWKAICPRVMFSHWRTLCETAAPGRPVNNSGDSDSPVPQLVEAANLVAFLVCVSV